VLTITLQGDELWDDEAEIFRYTDDIVLEFEHSLVSLSKWEAKHKKLFLTNDKKTAEETVSYIEAMLVTPCDPSLLNRLTNEHIEMLDAYVNDPMTGTTFHNMAEQAPKTSERISSELIYYWMSQFQIDKDCENWHLNRLFTLIRVHHAKSQKPKPMSKQKRVQTMAEINAARKAKLGTSG